MSHKIIENAIEIKTSVDKVWRVFTDASITRELGGEYITDWETGSSIEWKGNDGNLYTHGTILQVQPNKLLKHTLADPANVDQIISVITYRFNDDNGKTTLRATEALNHAVSEKEFEQALEGWTVALESMKDLAEKI
jgi:uncharacterized protein YndB with AHSA1/START domain